MGGGDQRGLRGPGGHVPITCFKRPLPEFQWRLTPACTKSSLGSAGVAG